MWGTYFIEAQGHTVSHNILYQDNMSMTQCNKWQMIKLKEDQAYHPQVPPGQEQGRWGGLGSMFLELYHSLNQNKRQLYTCSIFMYPLRKVVKITRNMVKVFWLFFAYLSIILRISQRIDLNESIISKTDNGISKKLKVHRCKSHLCLSILLGFNWDSKSKVTRTSSAPRIYKIKMKHPQTRT